jgi:hypothetical protein
MKKAMAEFIAEKLEDMTGEKHSIREGYSGRGMFGSETFGIVCDSPMQVLDVVMECLLNGELDEDDIEELNDKLDEERGPNTGFRFDGMGLQYIVY